MSISNARVQAVVAVAVLAVVVALLIISWGAPNGSAGHVRSPSDLTVLAEASRRISSQTLRTVVRIESLRDRSTINDEIEQLFGDRSIPLESQGSGICVGEDAVLTNYHVVANATDIVVKINDIGAPATLVGFDALTDLALLRVRGLELTAATWGDSENLSAGDFVWAIGNPFGLQRSITFGIVSAVSQEGTGGHVLQEFMQTDAAVNPGGSGGPLIDIHGHVVGINTAILGESFRGISFAIPSNTARAIADELQSTGEIRRGWLGVRLRDDIASGGFVDRINQGARVMAFTGNIHQPSPAQSTGIEIGDLIVRWNDTAVTNSVQIARLAAKTKPGTMVQITILRGLEELTLPVQITTRP